MADELEAYLRGLASRGDEGLQRGAAATVVRRVVSPSLRFTLKRRATNVVAPWSRRRASRMAATSRPYVNLGAGTAPVPGWVNVDLLGMGADLAWDLTRGLPFPDGSLGAVLLEHVLEHFPAAEALDLLRAVHRVLAPGAVVRASVPDLGAYMQSYAADGGFVAANRPERPTAMFAVAEVVYCHGHRSAWDGESLVLVLQAAGFTDCRVTPFGESRIEPAPDSPQRKAESVYVEGIRPTAERPIAERGVADAKSSSH